MKRYGRHGDVLPKERLDAWLQRAIRYFRSASAALPGTMPSPGQPITYDWMKWCINSWLFVSNVGQFWHAILAPDLPAELVKVSDMHYRSTSPSAQYSFFLFLLSVCFLKNIFAFQILSQWCNPNLIHKVSLWTSKYKQVGKTNCHNICILVFRRESRRKQCSVWLTWE